MIEGLLILASICLVSGFSGGILSSTVVLASLKRAELKAKAVEALVEKHVDEMKKHADEIKNAL